MMCDIFTILTESLPKGRKALRDVFVMLFDKAVPVVSCMSMIFAVFIILLEEKRFCRKQEVSLLQECYDIN